MNPLIAVLIIALMVGGTLSVMNKACKSGHHFWCMSMPWHGAKAKLGRQSALDPSFDPKGHTLR